MEQAQPSQLSRTKKAALRTKRIEAIIGWGGAMVRTYLLPIPSPYNMKHTIKKAENMFLGSGKTPLSKTSISGMLPPTVWFKRYHASVFTVGGNGGFDIKFGLLNDSFISS